MFQIGTNHRMGSYLKYEMIFLQLFYYFFLNKLLHIHFRYILYYLQKAYKKNFSEFH